MGEFRSLPKVKPYHGRSRRYSINCMRSVFFQSVLFYYILLMSLIISTFITIAAGDPSGYFISLFLSIPSIALQMIYRHIRKDPDGFARRQLKHSLTGLFTTDHDEFIYGRKLDRGYSIPKRKFELLIRFGTSMTLIVSAYLLVLIQMPIHLLDRPFRIPIIMMSIALFLLADLLIIRSLRKYISKRFRDPLLTGSF